MSRRRTSAAVALVLLAAGCGGDGDPAPSAPRAGERAKPEDVRCRQLRTRAATDRLARRLVDQVVAPADHSARETAGIISESLYATCRQPKLPGVEDAGDYKPVEPVLKQVQRHFDTDEIGGGHD